MVEEDWQRLIAFRERGEVSPVGPRKRHFLAVDAAGGFSPRDLIECLARFWDVHIIGAHDLVKAELADPKRDIKAITPEAYARLDSAGLLRGPDDAYSGLAYELAMDVAAGHYAAPYRWLRDASESFRANILFPIVGHLALHCPQPISFFIEFCAYLLRNFDLPATKQIEEAWQQSYAEIFKLAQMLAQARYCGPLWPAAVVVEHGPLMEHPGYRAAWLNLTAHVRRLAEGPDRRLIGDEGLGREQRAGLTVDYMLACNGVRKHRTADVLMLTAPPLVRFANGGQWILPDLFQAETDVPIDTSGIDLSLVRRELVASLIAIERDWRKLQLALTGY